MRSRRHLVRSSRHRAHDIPQPRIVGVVAREEPFRTWRQKGEGHGLEPPESGRDAPNGEGEKRASSSDRRGRCSFPARGGGVAFRAALPVIAAPRTAFCPRRFAGFNCLAQCFQDGVFHSRARLDLLKRCRLSIGLCARKRPEASQNAAHVVGRGGGGARARTARSGR